MAPKSKLTQTQQEEILDSYLSGQKMNDLYKKYEHIVSSTTISRLIRKSGVPLRSQGVKRSICWNAMPKFIEKSFVGSIID